MDRKLVFTAAAALALSGVAVGQQPATPAQPVKPQQEDQKPEVEVKPLTIGDKAPAIDIEHWIKGDKVAKFEPGNVYIVEFWATWCPPCRESMPHISELQKKFADYDVTFIGVSDEDLETVEGWLPQENKKLKKKWSDVIEYTLATDPDKSVYNDYMKAASQGGIPTAFVVGKDSKIEWIGHPMSIDKVLDAVVKDSWDRAKFKAEFEAEIAAERELQKVQGELMKAQNAGDFKKVIEILDGLIAKNPKDLNSRMMKAQLLMTELDQPQEAYRLLDAVAKDNWDNAQLLNQIGWTIVDDPTIKVRDLDLALRLANRANELTGGKDGAILDTVARVYYEKGDLDKAIEIQKKAVEAGGPMAEQLAETLKKYEEEKAKGG